MPGKGRSEATGWDLAIGAPSLTPALTALREPMYLEEKELPVDVLGRTGPELQHYSRSSDCSSVGFEP